MSVGFHFCQWFIFSLRYFFQYAFFFSKDFSSKVFFSRLSHFVQIGSFFHSLSKYLFSFFIFSKSLSLSFFNKYLFSFFFFQQVFVLSVFFQQVFCTRPGGSEVQSIASVMKRLYAVGTTTRRESCRQAKCALEKGLKTLKNSHEKQPPYITREALKGTPTTAGTNPIGTAEAGNADTETTSEPAWQRTRLACRAWSQESQQQQLPQKHKGKTRTQSCEAPEEIVTGARGDS